MCLLERIWWTLYAAFKRIAISWVGVCSYRKRTFVFHCNVRMTGWIGAFFILEATWNGTTKVFKKEFKYGRHQNILRVKYWSSSVERVSYLTRLFFGVNDRFGAIWYNSQSEWTLSVGDIGTQSISSWNLEGELMILNRIIIERFNF